MTPDKITRNFQRCKDWEEKYLYLIELGERLPPYPSEKHPDQLVRGCQSQVWLQLELDKDSSRLVLHTTSDAAIVRGLLALLHIAYHDVEMESALNFDIRKWFEDLQLLSHLTPTRASGLDAIVRQIQSHCRQVSSESAQ